MGLVDKSSLIQGVRTDYSYMLDVLVRSTYFFYKVIGLLQMEASKQCTSNFHAIPEVVHPMETRTTDPTNTHLQEGPSERAAFMPSNRVNPRDESKWQ
jgi:hypothetical protein